MSMPPGSVFSPPRPPATSRQGYADVDKLENAHGLVAVISQRRRSGKLTFAMFREFERDGVVERTGFVPEDLGEAYIDMVRLTLERCAELRRKGDLPFPVAPEDRL